jgi:hypothetical protein
MSDRYFPHRAAGFACNPFRALGEAEEAHLAILPPAVLDAFEGSGDHLQILGENGRGKSTALRGLAALAEERGLRVAFEYLPERTARFGTDPRGLDLFALDEAQRLDRRERSRLLAGLQAGARPDGAAVPRLVVSSHADLAPLFARHYLPLTSIRLSDLGAEHTRAVLDGRLAAFALGDRPHATLSEDAHAWLAARFGDDLRAAIWLLYEAFQVLRAPEVVDARRLRELVAR